VVSGQCQWQRYPLEVMGARIMVESPLVGRHQLRNLALAIAAAEELHHQGIVQITPQTIAQGIRENVLAGTFPGSASRSQSRVLCSMSRIIRLEPGLCGRRFRPLTRT